ncbi:MAG: hypothetical protein QOH81_627 [Sphingomonadales bacterium]|jgi:cytochrome P450|nr:hypothetical protein [Sphingomonadales bacterium]
MGELSLDQELTAYSRGDLNVCAWPYPLYERLRAHGRVVDWKSGPAKLLTHHEDVRAAMAKELPLHNDGYRYGRLAEGVLSRLPEGRRDIFYRVFDFETLYVTRNEGQQHRRLRGCVHRAFLPRSLATLRDSIQWHVDELIDRMAASDAPDWKSQVADKLPARVISDLFGVPQADRDKLWHFAEIIAAHFSMTERTLCDAAEALDDFRGYALDLIHRVRSTGHGAQLTKDLIDAVDAGALNEEELVAMLLVVLFGGTETTTNLLGNGFLAVQRTRSEWDKLVAEPAKVRPAIEELLRYDSALQYLPRFATEDFELHGVKVEKNETVIIVIGAANRDPEVFDDPNVLRIDRPNSDKHLALAVGPHFCLGAALARMEAEVAFTTLTRRFPDIRLIGDEVSYRGSAMLRAVASLPVDLGASKH